MRNRSHPVRLAAATLALAAFGALWFELAPTALGGSATYVATDGISMAPRFKTGDLVMVRRRSSYRVGEIVAYRSRFLGTLVLHRIVARDGDRFVFKGDNNDFTDPEHPHASQLVGALVLQVPTAAKRLRALHGPGALGLLTAIGVALLLGGSARRRRRRRHEGRTSPPLGWFVGLGAIGAAILTPLIVVAVVSSRRPATTMEAHPRPYLQRGSFSYDAGATWSTAYPHGTLATGDPVFLALVHRVHVRFSYRFTAPGDHAVHGTVSLVARLRASNGWQQQLTLSTPHPFKGDRVAVEGTVDLRPLPALLRRLEAATGVPSTYTLTMQPHVRISGHVRGAHMTTRFTPQLPFTLDSRELLPELGDSAGSILDPSAKGTVDTSTVRQAMMSFKVGHASVAAVRSWSKRMLTAACCALLGLALALARSGAGAERIPARYRREVVSVDRVDAPSVHQIVDVPDLDTLAGIAARYDRMILHESGSDVFSVADDGVLYRFGPAAAVHRLPQRAA